MNPIMKNKRSGQLSLISIIGPIDSNATTTVVSEAPTIVSKHHLVKKLSCGLNTGFAMFNKKTTAE